MYERVFEKLDFCICDSIRSQPLAWLEVEVKRSLIKFAWPLVSQKNPLRRCQQELEVQGLLCPPLALYVSLLFFLPLILISSKYLLNSRDGETPYVLEVGAMIRYAVRARAHQIHKRARVDETTNTHESFVLAVTQ